MKMKSFYTIGILMGVVNFTTAVSSDSSPFTTIPTTAVHEYIRLRTPTNSNIHNQAADPSKHEKNTALITTIMSENLYESKEISTQKPISDVGKLAATVMLKKENGKEKESTGLGSHVGGVDKEKLTSAKSLNNGVEHKEPEITKQYRKEEMLVESLEESSVKDRKIKGEQGKDIEKEKISFTGGSRKVVRDVEKEELRIKNQYKKEEKQAQQAEIHSDIVRDEKNNEKQDTKVGTYVESIEKEKVGKDVKTREPGIKKQYEKEQKQAVKLDKYSRDLEFSAEGSEIERGEPRLKNIFKKEEERIEQVQVEQHREGLKYRKSKRKQAKKIDNHVGDTEKEKVRYTDDPRNTVKEKKGPGIKKLHKTEEQQQVGTHIEGNKKYTEAKQTIHVTEKAVEGFNKQKGDLYLGQKIIGAEKHLGLFGTQTQVASKGERTQQALFNEVPLSKEAGTQEKLAEMGKFAPDLMSQVKLVEKQFVDNHPVTKEQVAKEDRKFTEGFRKAGKLIKPYEKEQEKDILKEDMMKLAEKGMKPEVNQQSPTHAGVTEKNAQGKVESLIKPYEKEAEKDKFIYKRTGDTAELSEKGMKPAGEINQQAAIIVGVIGIKDQGKPKNLINSYEKRNENDKLVDKLTDVTELAKKEKKPAEEINQQAEIHAEITRNKAQEKASTLLKPYENEREKGKLIEKLKYTAVLADRGMKPAREIDQQQSANTHAKSSKIN